MIVSGVENLKLERCFEQATTRIILSAPPYAPFGHNRTIRHALFTALARTGGLSLTALDLPGTDAPWIEEMRVLLRPQMDLATMQDEIIASHFFLSELYKNFPQQVHRFCLQTKPCFPFLIIDDQIMFGHFAHARVPTPHGFWGTIIAPVQELLDLVDSAPIPQQMSSRHRAASRIVSEYLYQLQHAVPI